MTQIAAYKPPRIGRLVYQVGAFFIIAYGLVLLSDFIPAGRFRLLAEVIGVLMLFVGVGLYLFGKRWIDCPHCGNEIKRAGLVCPSCGKEVFGATT